MTPPGTKPSSKKLSNPLWNAAISFTSTEPITNSPTSILKNGPRRWRPATAAPTSRCPAGASAQSVLSTAARNNFHAREEPPKEVPKKKTVHAKVKINESEIITVVNAERKKSEEEMDITPAENEGEGDSIVVDGKESSHKKHLKIIPRKVVAKKMYVSLCVCGSASLCAFRDWLFFSFWDFSVVWFLVLASVELPKIFIPFNQSVIIFPRISFFYCITFVFRVGYRTL